ncbi:MAG: ATP-binding cassette domain-containing protein [Ruminococcus sp.]|nr:ATP-binding cassette domain-containing protein [Ruminococcus sp.]
MKKESIIICNAYENNLKNISLEIPLTEFTCITGPSGCGKSSLVYDTIYAESQRNFLESMSGNMYGQKLMDKPRVEEIKNLRPALNMSQNYYNVNPRSTIGTVTDISYYLRTMFALIANESKGLKIDTNFFSFNNPSSYCEKCKGLGEEYILSEEQLMPDLNKTLSNGGILYFKGSKKSLEYKLLEAECEYFGIDINKKVSELTERERQQLLYREDNIDFSLNYKTPKGRYRKKLISRKGVVAELQEAIKDIDTPSTFASISKYLTKTKCSSCGGTKLNKSVLDIKIADKNIAEAEAMPFDKLIIWLDEIEEATKKMACIEKIIQLIYDVKRRIKCIIELNLEYLSLGRSIPSLSGGEVQRIRLANQLSCSLCGLVYILDEPCKGLHYRNIDSVISASKSLVNKGNTVIAIEHNKQYISEANRIIELGPVGGPNGGYIISENENHCDFIYNLNFKHYETSKDFISLCGINYHNLKNIDVSIPYGRITCISGVSGAGKSTLTAVIAECCEQKGSLKCRSATNTSKIKKVLYVNQQPIGKTPRSTVVSYLGIYDIIRELFARTTDAKKLGLSVSDFSMNVAGGRCEYCQGTGKKKIELTYMPDSYIECPKCHGNRFIDKVLSVKYKGVNINDVLDYPIERIVDIFEDVSSVSNILQCMLDIGMGYISLGQMSMTLSGGESQRIKLAKCLGVKSNGKNLYILDEPTSGLSSEDIRLLENILLKLGKTNETVLIIEHNIEFIASIADYLIDLGTVAGDKGGVTLLQGSPLDVIYDEKSSWKDFEDYLKLFNITNK